MFESHRDPVTFSVFWSIENITCNPLRPTEMMTSPSFRIEALGATEWNLSLFPRGVRVGSEHMSLYLHRMHGRPDLSSITVRLEISLDCYDTRIANSGLIQRVRFKEDDYWGIPNFVLIADSPHVADTSLTRAFTIRCEITSINNNDEPPTDGRIHLMRLSKDMRRLCETRQLCDVVLKSGKTELKAHRAVLVARSPKFFYRLKFDEEQQPYPVADVPFLSGPVLEMVVFYLYSGKLMVPASETPLELFSFAEQYDLPDLVKKMQTFPDVCTARTILNVERKSVYWDIKPRLESDGSLLRIVPTPSMYFENIVVSCKGVGESYKCSIKRIEASFRLTGVKKYQPVFLRCKILVTEDGDDFWDLFTGEHIFDSNEEWWCVTTPVDCFVRLPNVTGVCFEFDVCDGRIFSRMQDDWTFISESPSLRHDGIKLSSDLKLLRNDHAFTDVEVVCDRAVFCAHKAILAARSPVFEKMFWHDVIENQEGMVYVPDVTSEVMELLLLYIYSGRIRDLTCETAAGLYEAADKYAIIELRDKCSSFLLDALEDGNAEGIWFLADMHYDFDFKEKVTQFIERNKDDEVFVEKRVVPT